MSEGGHHHDGGMDGQQGFSDPGFQPGMFPPPEAYQNTPDPFPPNSPTQFPQMPLGYQRGQYGPRGYGRRRYPLRVGSPGWVVSWIVRLAVIAFIIYVAFHVFHGAASTP